MGKRSKKEDFSNFMASVLQNSMLTGIPQIATAANAPKKIIRALVFVMCLFGFVYQSLVFMNMYWEYKTVIDVKVESPKVIDLPSMTVCNYNGIISSKVCKNPELMDEYCVNLTTEHPKEYWCKCFPRYCDWDNDLPLVIRNSYVFKMAYWPFEKYKPYLQDWGEMVQLCTFVMADKEELYTGCPIRDAISIRCPTDNNHNLNVCYTIYSTIGQPEASPRQVFSAGIMNLLLDAMTYEYGTHLARESMEVSFHSPRGIMSPYEYGFSMQTSSKNIFHLKKTVKHLLPPPYDTQCFDYVSEWKARGGYGPTNERECIEECKVNESMKAFGCISGMFFAPSNLLRCEGIYGWGGSNVTLMTTNVMKCSEEKCKPACYEESYQVVKDSTLFDDVPDCHSKLKGNRPDQSILVQVNFEGMETTTYSYSPKFQNIETFSYLGGYVGMWLGISLVAVFDFFETVVLMMRYPCQKYVLYRNRQSKIANLKKLHRTV